MRIENTGVHHAYSSKWKKESPINTLEVKPTSVHQEGTLESVQKEAKEMTKLLQQVHFEETVREEKLAAIKEKMETGTYQVSGKEIIAKLMGER